MDEHEPVNSNIVDGKVNTSNESMPQKRSSKNNDSTRRLKELTEEDVLGGI